MVVIIQSLEALLGPSVTLSYYCDLVTGMTRMAVVTGRTR